MTLTTLLLSVLFTAPTNLFDADLTVQANTPSEALATAGDGWIGFEFPMNETRHGPCCWRGHLGDMQLGCRLEGRDGGFTIHADGVVEDLDEGTRRSDRVPASDRAQAYLKIHRGEPSELRIVSTTCPVDAGETRLTWLESVAPAAGFSFLAGLLDERRVADAALHAVAMHADESAAQRLHEIAATRGELAEPAIFWLGEARGAEGYGVLARLLDELPRGDRRRQINFALSQNDTPGAADLLYRISQDDRDDEQRGDALFWLAESDHPHALEALHGALERDLSEDVAQRALHALAELEQPEAADLLERTATTHQLDEIRGQALFWLGEGYPQRALPALAAALEDPQIDSDIASQALLALAELEEEAAADVLAGAAGDHPDREVRGQALFWLAEGYPDRALPIITAILADETDNEVRERAVFALSQLPDEQATAALLEIVRGPYPSAVRKQALFWLAESDDPAALEALEKLLSSDG